ncbi:MAG: tetratricopeptide repeat protein, partial [Treponema sp.]|nr:tetratricopeptide repeat protein [Treponema sp.]
DSDAAARQTAALESLAAYLSKGGIVGARANMLAADIYFQKKDWNAAKDGYLKAAAAGEKLYTAAICHYNAGVCAEELGDNQSAASCYETAAGKEGFNLAPHALFNLGRVSESLSDFAKAKESYQKIIDTYSGDEFAKLAHSRLIALTAAGKLE